MVYDPARHARKSIRLPDCDYSYPGMYFVTICAEGRRCVFGRIDSSNAALSPLGTIVQTEWLRTADLRPYISLDKYVIMPNHFHGILTIRQAESELASGGTARRAPTEEFGRPVSRSLPTTIRAFKSAVTKAAGLLTIVPCGGVWQRGYFEHIIRDEDALERIREYILNNPARWELDKENPNRSGEDEFDKWLSKFKSRPQTKVAGKPKEQE
jgi:putative transposase